MRQYAVAGGKGMRRNVASMCVRTSLVVAGFSLPFLAVEG